MLYTHDEAFAFIAHLSHVGLALPPTSLAAWRRDLASADATIHPLVPAWWWRLMGTETELGGRRATVHGARAAEPPTFVDTADADVLHVATPLVRLVEGTERAVELVRLRTLDSLVGDLVQLDALLVGTGADALPLLSGASRLLATLRPILVLDLGNRFGEPDPETDPKAVAAALEASSYQILPRLPYARPGRYLIARHLSAPSLCLKRPGSSVRPCALEFADGDARGAGWGPRPMLAVELPPRVERLQFIVGGGHSGDVRLYADLCGRFWFEATAPVAQGGRVAFAVPHLLPGPAITRFRLTPVRVGTPAIPIRFRILSIIWK